MVIVEISWISLEMRYVNLKRKSVYQKKKKKINHIHISGLLS